MRRRVRALLEEAADLVEHLTSAEPVDTRWIDMAEALDAMVEDLEDAAPAGEAGAGEDDEMTGG